MLQQFALHLRAHVLTFGNPSAPPRPGDSSIGERHLDEAGCSIEATYGKTRLHDSVVGGGWVLRSKPMCDWESQKTKDFKKEGGGNGPHN